MTTIPETCSGERYPQACYHYYSAIHNYDFVESTFTCGDEIEREPGTATAEWTKQHKDKKWQHSYFMPPGTKEKKLGQIIRWLPRFENSGAANTEWARFCSKHDGGRGNGQLQENGQINNDLVELIKPGKEIKSPGENGKMTTTTQFEAKFTRAYSYADADVAISPNQINSTPHFHLSPLG
ncbi:hypothetical protein W97_02688 [Coniosporium apollinis CBS 100218]|uniref:Uncharacterized protein n=1 Tax=Coniosporium apollinis (strain CBS 100218) TaxID=1168221 RepID=R7YNF8_CONA1|nr:uncharacterized protein W97_02688 [Coniosporium apollinis CBS 100218]EON63460.1 hypothetical protein W97_02688 [Coniosporium apollinis CBS 100218]